MRYEAFGKVCENVRLLSLAEIQLAQMLEKSQQAFRIGGTRRRFVVCSVWCDQRYGGPPTYGAMLQELPPRSAAGPFAIDAGGNTPVSSTVTSNNKASQQ